MRSLNLLACALSCALTFALSTPATAGPETTADLAAQVKAAETAFAQTMAARDLDAFAVHVADEALFFGKTDVLRGKAAVVAGWKAFFEGPDAPFSWAPERVEVLDSGTLAISTGPVKNPAGAVVGTFNSIWRREPDGRWRVVFDKGCPVCESPAKP
jgi:ketosteroid isomerase-like protein